MASFLPLTIFFAATLSPAEKSSFRLWLTFLAEAQYFNEEAVRPHEITDCSSLVRYAFREAFAKHDAEWRKRNPLPATPALPIPPFRSGPLFETASGKRHFADAETLMRANTRPLGREVRRAQAGDLLFYRQVDDPQNWHVMIFLGPSQFEGGGPYVLYHTGPVKKMRGELRRLRLNELVDHPQPRWRPVAGNAAFLGVYRWKVLEE